MRYLRLPLCAILLLFVAALPTAFAGEKKKAKEPAKPATDEVAKEALAQFKTEYKAKGLKGDDKLMQRDFAMKNLVKAPHKLIAKELGKIAKKKDADLATLAVMYLGELRPVAGAAGPEVVAAMKRHKKDAIFQMSALDSIGYMRYFGAREQIADLINHKDFAVKKYAIRTAGWTQDIRLLPDLLKLLGIEVKNEAGGSKEPTEKKGEKEVVEEGYSWEGVDVEYDTGTPGDHDQKMAEKIGKEQMAKNKAAAQAGKGGGSGGGATSVSGGGSASGPRGGTSRTLDELAPTILRALKAMTGEEFEGPKGIRLWLRANKKQIALLMARYDRREKAQREAAK